MHNHTSHDTDDGHISLSERTQAAHRSTMVSVWVNIALTCAQIVVGSIAHSQALIADGIHSLSDLLADFVVLIANKFSSHSKDDDHHYGHYRYETGASLVIGLLLIVVALGMLWAGVQKVIQPESIPPAQSMALYVAAVALISKELLFRYMLAVATRVRSSMLVANAWHARSDAASSLVVLIGITGSLLGYPILDPIAALMVGLMVLRMGVQFSWSAFHDLMDRSADEEDNKNIIQIIQNTAGVAGVHDVRTRKMGDMISVDAHVEVPANITVLEGHDITEAARLNVLKNMPMVMDVLIHMDPV